MDENTNKIIQDKFNSLPESIKDLILSDQYQNILIEIGQKYQLSQEQLGILERETTLVLMGLTAPDEFEDELKLTLKVEDLRNSQIAKDVNNNVFSRVKVTNVMNSNRPRQASFTTTKLG